VPTFERLARFDREFRRMPRELQRAFLAMLPVFVAALRVDPPSFPPGLRVKRVQGTEGVWEITFAADGRATFEYGAELHPGEPHVVWPVITRSGGPPRMGNEAGINRAATADGVRRPMANGMSHAHELGSGDRASVRDGKSSRADTDSSGQPPPRSAPHPFAGRWLATCTPAAHWTTTAQHTVRTTVLTPKTSQDVLEAPHC
jgi:hypothetical protein